MAGESRGRAMLIALIADAIDRSGMSARQVHRAARHLHDRGPGREERVSAMAPAEALQYRAFEARFMVAG